MGKYNYQYNTIWETSFKWITAVPDDKYAGKCKICNSIFKISSCGTGQIKMHASTKKHITATLRLLKLNVNAKNSDVNTTEIRQHQEYELDLDEESNMHYPEIIFDVDDSSDSFKPQNDIGELRRRQEAIRNHANNMSLRNNRPSRIKTVLDDANSKFLADFDPETSAREKRKLSRKTFTAPAALGKNATMYDNKGIFRLTGEDLCDCLDGECPGCHFPCPNCNGPKCGSTCRGMRKWGFEQIEHDAKDLVIYNEYNKRQPMY